MKASLVGVLSLPVVLLLPQPAAAQTARLASADVAPQPDSAQVLRGARGEQSAFERFRYRHLPVTHSGGGGTECGMRIGRFCFWFDDQDEDWTPPPEPPAIAERRARLLRALDDAAARLPGDGWIAGQRVRYHAEAGDSADALAAARACRAEPAWCTALEGYALHRAGRWTEAEAAFAAALAAMPEDERARWTEVETLLSPADRRALRAMGEEDAARAVERLWWLADPLWSEPGNERRTEHFARWVMDGLQARARQVRRGAWRGDSREVLLRYGWPVAWERKESPWYWQSAEGGVVGYTEARTWEWLPPLDAAAAPATLAGDEWPTEESAPTYTRYAPPYAAEVVVPDHQLAVFRRGGRAIVVAGYRLAHDHLPDGAIVRAALVAMEDARAEPVVARMDAAERAGALRITVPPRPTVVSLEVREDSSRVVGRLRRGIDVAADAPFISDLLLLADPDARPETLDDAATLARGGSTARPGERLAVYWEVYGLEDQAATLSVRVGLVPGEAGWARRQLEAIGIARAARTVRMRWDEEAGGGPVVGRALAVALPADLRPGEWTLEVTVEADGRAPETARRVITVVRD